MAKIPCESIGIMDYDSRDGLGIYQVAECSQWAVHGRARDALVDQNGRFGGSVAVDRSQNARSRQGSARTNWEGVHWSFSHSCPDYEEP
jgi:hypothetical protein